MFPMDKWELRKDMTGILFTTATAHEPPYVVKIDVDIENIDQLPRGYEVQ